jgi:hypothetical protein
MDPSVSMKSNEIVVDSVLLLGDATITAILSADPGVVVSGDAVDVDAAAGTLASAFVAVVVSVRVARSVRVTLAVNVSAAVVELLSVAVEGGFDDAGEGVGAISGTHEPDQQTPVPAPHSVPSSRQLTGRWEVRHVHVSRVSHELLCMHITLHSLSAWRPQKSPKMENPPVHHTRWQAPREQYPVSFSPNSHRVEVCANMPSAVQHSLLSSSGLSGVHSFPCSRAQLQQKEQFVPPDLHSHSSPSSMTPLPHCGPW